MLLGKFDLIKWMNEHPEAAAFVKPQKTPVKEGRRSEPRTAAGASRSERRAARFMRSIPGAVPGQDGHLRTFVYALILLGNYSLTREEARRVLDEWNAKWEPPWSADELERVLDEAANHPYFQGKPPSARFARTFI